MKSAEQLIIDHEKARAVLAKLKSDRVHLMSQCSNITTLQCGLEVGHGSCFGRAWDDLQDLIKENLEHYTYQEVMEESDGVCETCLESYKLKVGPMAEARRVFGNAKRAISVRGKKLISEG